MTDELAIPGFPRWMKNGASQEWALAIDPQRAVAHIEQEEGGLFYASVNSLDPVRRPFRSLDEALDWCQHMRGVEMGA